MSQPQRPPGMTDVARLAGVSHQTVSRVLNDSDRVRPATRERVEEAIRELGYRRNLTARTLVTRRSRVIGVIVAESGYHGPNMTSAAIQTAARERGYATLVAAIRDTSHDEVSQVLDLLRDHAVEGIVVIAPQPPLVEELRDTAHRLPVVLVADGVEVSDGMHTVSVDQYRGARLATRHLADLGHRSVAHVRGPHSWFDARQRERGWTDELRAAGLDAPEAVDGDWSSESGYRAGQRLMRHDLPDAVFCSNDYMALGLLSALADNGILAPRDVSIVGYDDVSGATHFRPPLTTVRQPFHELGEACVSVLLGVLDGEEGAPRHIEPTLIVRASAAARAR